MKIKPGFVVREVAGQIVALPTGEELNLNMMITLNETAKFLWEQLEQEQDRQQLVDALMAEYQIDADLAGTAVDGFLEKLQHHGFLA